MKIDGNVDVHDLTRLEGHGNIKIRIQSGNERLAFFGGFEGLR